MGSKYTENVGLEGMEVALVNVRRAVNVQAGGSSIRIVHVLTSVI